MSGKNTTARRPAALDISKVEVVAPHFRWHLSGVTSTVIQLVPLQAKTLGIATLGPGLPQDLPKLRWWQVPLLLKRPAQRPFRIWHARRNTEMLGGLILRHVFRAPMKLVFTSAGQRHKTRYTRWLLRRMDAVIATSARSGSFVDVPYRVSHHGIDLDSFRPAESAEETFAATGLPGKYAVGCFGRVRHQKGTDLFVQAMIELLPRYPDWTAIVTGRVTMEHSGFAEALQNQVAEAGLSDRILFLGEVPDIKIWYRRVSLYVAPSRNEGFGLTPLEAMASQTAVVASDAGAYAEMIAEGETGSVVPAGNGPALTRAIEKYLADPALAAAHGENALRHVRTHFPLEKEAGNLATVYEALWEQGSDR